MNSIFVSKTTGRWLLTVFLASFWVALQAQVGASYTFEMLAQEPIQIVNHPMPTGFTEKGDSTLTLYNTNLAEMAIYFVNGEQYHHILNPNPTGIILNGQVFSFFCDLEMARATNTSNFLEIYEFEYLSRKYICLLNYREDCLHKGCRYRCFNVFDVTEKDKVKAYSFSSVYSQTDTFADFNNDGIIDFVRAAPVPAEELKEVAEEERSLYHLVTTYSLDEGKAKELKNEGNAYYLQVKGQDEELSSFQIVKCDWFIPLKDQTGKVAERTPYFAPYISFDPKNDFLYDAKGFRVEKRVWVVLIADFMELDGALDYAEELLEEGHEDVYVYIDQYGRDLKFYVLLGNYWNKEKTDELKLKLQKMGINGRIVNMQKEF
ncbi:hypothetical protein [Hugenholtzia roseola]|uniref:hypothetical protein n=1 Tax=Hugenholtzia roseola TaxID=1002 RepID=UPI00041906B8|nr:hypothetical protein [Hugenholtzia roseola]